MLLSLSFSSKTLLAFLFYHLSAHPFPPRFSFTSTKIASLKIFSSLTSFSEDIRWFLTLWQVGGWAELCLIQIIFTDLSFDFLYEDFQECVSHVNAGKVVK